MAGINPKIEIPLPPMLDAANDTEDNEMIAVEAEGDFFGNYDDLGDDQFSFYVEEH